MLLPPEIIEKILTHSDGKTLLSARHVCRQWKDMVEYISKKTGVWHRCCMDEIPKKELTQYLDNYNKCDREIWFFIYRNWVTWQNIGITTFETVLSPVEIPRITCLDVYGDYIAIGSEDGRVRIFNKFWKPLSITRHQAEKVTKVSFLYNTGPNAILKIVIGYPKSLIISDLYSTGYNHLIIEDVMAHSVHKDYICYEKLGGRMTIEKISPNPADKLLETAWFSRVYSPSRINCRNMWDGTFTLLLRNDIRQVNCRKLSNVPQSSTPELCSLTFTELPNTETTYRILRDDTVIALSRPEQISGNEYMEIVILEGGTNYVKKLFSTAEVLQASITCICLYGNTLVLGVDTGIVYFYHVPSWKHFTIKDYQKKIIIGKHPITSIVAKETKEKRVYYVTSTFNIHEVVGFSLNF